jgi:hypothetical protein
MWRTCFYFEEKSELFSKYMSGVLYIYMEAASFSPHPLHTF